MHRIDGSWDVDTTKFAVESWLTARNSRDVALLTDSLNGMSWKTTPRVSLLLEYSDLLHILLTVTMLCLSCRMLFWWRLLCSYIRRRLAFLVLSIFLLSFWLPLCLPGYGAFCRSFALLGRMPTLRRPCCARFLVGNKTFYKKHEQTNWWKFDMKTKLKFDIKTKLKLLAHVLPPKLPQT